MDWVCSMTLGRPGGPMRASALQERQLWRGGKAPQALLRAASSPLREEPFCAGKARVKVSSLCGEVVERQR